MSEQPGPGGPNRKPDTDDIAGQIEKATRSMELRDPDAGLPLSDRIVNRIVEIVGVTVLVAIVAVVFSNAVSRYALNYSFAWAEEIVQMSMPWLAMTGVFLSVRRGTMIRIEYFFEKIPWRWQGTVARFGYAVNVGVLLLMAWVSVDFVRLFGGDVALYVQIPTAWSTSALVFGAAGAAMAYLAEFHKEWRHRRHGAGHGGMPS
ncbi:MAG: TRAP transporter small permease [Alphaproteobacteria bacterium]|nr:TRAP transporter small permease [Alphaproteobacteria bacterium]